MAKIRMKRITAAWARRAGACEEAVERFERRFPNGLDLTDAEEVQRAWRLPLDDLTWFFNNRKFGKDLCTNGVSCCGTYLEAINKEELLEKIAGSGLPL